MFFFKINNRIYIYYKRFKYFIFTKVQLFKYLNRYEKNIVLLSCDKVLSPKKVRLIWVVGFWELRFSSSNNSSESCSPVVDVSSIGLFCISWN